MTSAAPSSSAATSSPRSQLTPAQRRYALDGMAECADMLRAHGHDPAEPPTAWAAENMDVSQRAVYDEWAEDPAAFHFLSMTAGPQRRRSHHLGRSRAPRTSAPRRRGSRRSSGSSPPADDPDEPHEHQPVARLAAGPLVVGAWS